MGATPYEQPSAIVIDTSAVSDVATVRIEVRGRGTSDYPIAPAGLYRTKWPDEVFQFHQLIHREGVRLMFETNDSTAALPVVGSTHEFRSWWIPRAMNAARDKSAVWEMVTVPGHGNHQHCLFTYEAINSGEVGYRSVYGWLTPHTYEQFIENDRLRIRREWRSIEGAV